METKTLLSGLIGFFIGGFIVSVAATTFEKPDTGTAGENGMVASLQDKTGDEYDEAFIAGMIEHHQSAVDMARLSADNAKHDEIRQMSEAIITTQQSEIDQMRQWQTDWGYGTSARPGDGMAH